MDGDADQYDGDDAPFFLLSFDHCCLTQDILRFNLAVETVVCVREDGNSWFVLRSGETSSVTNGRVSRATLLVTEGNFSARCIILSLLLFSCSLGVIVLPKCSQHVRVQNICPVTFFSHAVSINPYPFPFFPFSFSHHVASWEACCLSSKETKAWHTSTSRRFGGTLPTQTGSWRLPVGSRGLRSTRRRF